MAVWALLAGLRSAESSLTAAPMTVWTDIQLIHQQVESARQELGHRNLQDEEDLTSNPGLFCRGVIEIFDALAPPNENRDCSCNFWRRSLECSYENVQCGDKVLPTMDITFDLGIRTNTVHICQGFMEEEFDEVCIEADLDGILYGSCNGATMGKGFFGTKECACTVCEGGLTLDIDCTEKHPLAVTNGCQRVFFQDTCLDFKPTPPAVEAENTPKANATLTLKATQTEDLIIAYNNGTEEIQKEDVVPIPEVPVEVEAKMTDDEILFDIISSNLPVTVGNPFTQRAAGEKSTPSQQASAWLMDDPNFDSYTSTKLIQRFAMAALHYTTTMNDTDWIRSDDWLSYSVDECNWYSISEDTCIQTGELETLDLSENDLFGPLSSDMGYLRSVKYLYLPYNYLTGTLPTEIGGLSNLIDFDIHGSELIGTIPTEIGKLVHLEAVSLQYNWLEGTVPSEIGLLTNVYAIELQGNLLNGTVPEEVCNLIEEHGVHLFVDCGPYAVQCDCGCECNTG